MDLSTLKVALESLETQESILERLKEFNTKNAEANVFDNKTKQTTITSLMKLFGDNIKSISFTEDSNSTNLQVLLASTECLRILTRDGITDFMLETENIQSIVSTAGLYYQDVPFCLAMKNRYTANSPIQTDVWVEGTKTLINIIFVNHNSPIISDILYSLKKIGLLECLLGRLRVYMGPNPVLQPLDMIVYDLKLLFLITACSSSERAWVLQETDGLQVMCSLIHQWVYFSFRQAPSSIPKKYLITEIRKEPSPLSLEENVPLTSQMLFDATCVTTLPEIKVVGIIVDSLKILFSLTANWSPEFYDKSSNKECLKRVYNDLRLLVVSFSGWSSADVIYTKLFNDCVNLLMNIPYPMIPVLIPKIGSTVFSEVSLGSVPPPCTPSSVEGANKGAGQDTLLLVQFEERNMSIVKLLIDRLDLELKSNEDKREQMALTKITLLPTLRTLARGNSTVRHFVRKRILPPLKKVTSRPEDGQDLKARLVKLMVHADHSLAYSTADFLFVLCKENVDRLVKYTGFGNAAGLLMQRGLLAGGSHEGEADYSSDSGDSDTEEFLECQSELDPITGAPKVHDTSVLDSMTEEEKEAEAVSLMNAIDKLNKTGVIKMVDTSGQVVSKENMQDK